MMFIEAEKAFVKEVFPKLASITDITPYSREYLNRLMLHPEYYTHIYARILTFAQSATPSQKITTLLDYGGGTGLLSAFALFAGIPHVYYMDIFPDAASDAQRIGAHLQLQANSYLTGEMQSLPQPADAIVSMDVIEHIYHLPSFFNNSVLHHPHAVHAHSTGANPYHPVIRRRLQLMQHRNEWKGQTPPPGAKPTDIFEPYIHIRKQLIHQQFPFIKADDLQQLSIASRGLQKEDIFAMVTQFLETGSIPKPIAHPTNTCNPLNGNWSERLLTLKEVRHFAAPFRLNGKLNTIGYNTNKKSMMARVAAQLLNMAGSLGGPYIHPLMVFLMTPDGAPSLNPPVPPPAPQ
jgi:hypothetical protein